MRDMFDRYAGHQMGNERGDARVAPALAMAVTAGSSLGLWVVLALALRWAATVAF